MKVVAVTSDTIMSVIVAQSLNMGKLPSNCGWGGKRGFQVKEWRR